MKELTSRQKSAMETREKILDAALRLFSQKGFNGVAIKEISRLMNISEGLFYHYFPTKKVLLLAVFEKLSHEEFSKDFFIDSCKCESLEQSLKLLSSRLYNIMEARKELILVILSESLVNQALAKMVSAIQQSFSEELRRNILQIIDCKVDEYKLDLLVKAYYGSIFQFFILKENPSPQKDETDKDEFFSTVSEVFALALNNIIKQDERK